MKVLIISNYFYPVNKIGALRINAFAKYFHLAGLSVTVLTEGEKDECVQWGGCQVYYVKDPVMTDAYLWRSISERKRWLPRRIAASLLRRVFLDEKRIWQVKAFKKARELFRQNVFDVVLSSFFPLAPHLIAMKLRNSGFRFYWIADMRDEMSKSPFISSNYAMRLKLHERKIVCRADLVTSVSKPILDDFRSLGCHDGFLEVRNGYDYEEVHDVNFQTCFTMTYTGSFYGSIKPDNWFKAFSELISEGMLPPDSVIKIVGNYSNLNVPQSILANVVLLKPVPHEEALRISIMETDVLVMVHPLGRKGVYSGKLFDYLATNKPILALCDPDDVIAELLKDTGAGFVASESDIGDIKRAIIKCYFLWKNKEVLPRNWDRISQNSRRSQAQILIDYLSAQNTLM